MTAKKSWSGWRHDSEEKWVRMTSWERRKVGPDDVMRAKKSRSGWRHESEEKWSRMTSWERRKVIPDDGGRTRFETCCVAMEKEAPLVKPLLPPSSSPIVSLHHCPPSDFTGKYRQGKIHLLLTFLDTVELYFYETLKFFSCPQARNY